MRLIFSNAFPAEKQLQFLTDLGQWLGDGQSPDRALSGMELIARERNDNVEIRVITKLRAALAQGKSIAQGMNSDFSEELQLLVDVGQQAGCLPDLIASYRSFRQRRYELLKRCGRGLVYPVILLLAALVALAFIGGTVIPRFKEIDGSATLPLISQVLESGGRSILTVGPLVLFILPLIIAALSFLIPNWHSPYRHYLEGLTAFTVYRVYNGIYLLQGLSLLLSCRLNLENALRVFEPRSSTYLKNHIQIMRQRLARGEIQLHKILNTHLLSPAAIYRLQIGAAVQQSKSKLFSQLAERLLQDTERLIISRQRSLVYICFITAITLIGLIILGLGQLFTNLAAQWA